MSHGKQVRTERWTIADANRSIGRDLEPGWWEFLVRRLSVTGLSFDAERQEVVFESFLPVRDLVTEALDEIAARRVEVVACAHCGRCFDLDREDGIFGDPARLEVFVCGRCATTLTAREFYDRYLRT